MMYFKFFLPVICVLITTACQNNQPIAQDGLSNSIIASISSVAEMKARHKEKGEAAPDSTAMPNECKDPRPTVCTREFNPVCATLKSGQTSYSNACVACADLNVIRYTYGEC